MVHRYYVFRGFSFWYSISIRDSGGLLNNRPISSTALISSSVYNFVTTWIIHPDLLQQLTGVTYTLQCVHRPLSDALPVTDVLRCEFWIHADPL